MTEPLDLTGAIEAGAKALFALHEPDMNAWRWDKPNPNGPDGPFAWHDYWTKAAAVTIQAALAHLRLTTDGPSA